MPSNATQRLREGEGRVDPPLAKAEGILRGCYETESIRVSSHFLSNFRRLILLGAVNDTLDTPAKPEELTFPSDIY